jgi:hypothetical protein
MLLLVKVYYIFGHYVIYFLFFIIILKKIQMVTFEEYKRYQKGNV